ncbi:hypothetical protein PENFLA_c048G06597 [Penicillium flavigenum]|uniref:Uncharacterized protein n=1 Tax=Penicillium flavigenum TaxID=254877 RepID=A0A1V6SHA1_9EURO|nr:hypothetical protein PENFLA_c048G06597 [Penicillium flavigenum]
MDAYASHLDTMNRHTQWTLGHPETREGLSYRTTITLNAIMPATFSHRRPTCACPMLLCSSSSPQVSQSANVMSVGQLISIQAETSSQKDGQWEIRGHVGLPHHRGQLADHRHQCQRHTTSLPARDPSPSGSSAYSTLDD